MITNKVMKLCDTESSIEPTEKEFANIGRMIVNWVSLPDESKHLFLEQSGEVQEIRLPMFIYKDIKRSAFWSKMQKNKDGE